MTKPTFSFVSMLAVVVLGAKSGAPILEGQSSTASIAIPQGGEVLKSSNAVACEALLSTSIAPSLKGASIEAITSAGKDRLAIEVHGRTLRFMTRQSVESGGATPAEFSVLRNDADSVVAVNEQFAALGSTLDTVVINKRNGLAVWTKSRSRFLFDDQPDVQAFYLKCR